MTLVLFLKDCPQRARGGEKVVVVRDRHELAERVQKSTVRGGPQQLCIQALEVMLTDGWVIGRLDKKVPRLTVQAADEESIFVHWNRDDTADREAG